MGRRIKIARKEKTTSNALFRKEISGFNKFGVDANANDTEAGNTTVGVGSVSYFSYPIGFNLQPDFEISYPIDNRNFITESNPGRVVSIGDNIMSPGTVNNLKNTNDSVHFIWTDFVRLYNNKIKMQNKKTHYSYYYSSGSQQSYVQSIEYNYPINTAHNYGANNYITQDACSNCIPWPYIGLGFYFNENLTPQYLYPKKTDNSVIVTNFDLDYDASNTFVIRDSSYLPILWDASGVVAYEPIQGSRINNLTSSNVWPYLTTSYGTGIESSPSNLYSKIISCEMTTTTSDGYCTIVEPGILNPGHPGIYNSVDFSKTMRDFYN
jgi:hypothetical protein